MAFQLATLHTRKLKPLAAGAALLVLSGCATFSNDGGLNDVSTLTKQRTGEAVTQTKTDADAATTATLTNELLAKPLTPDAAVRLAMLNNKSLQASLAELGIAEADLVQTGRLPNPSFSFGRLRGGENIEIERSVMFDLVGLVTMPLRTGIERRRFEAAKLQAASRAVQVAADTRRAYFQAVAALQAVEFMETVKTSAEASAELAQRMAKIGNFSALDYQRQQVFYAEATAQLAATQHNAVASREELIRLLGITSQRSNLKLPNRLPELPKVPTQMTGAEAAAMEQRLDVQMARLETGATASALGLTRATGFINVLHVGYQNVNENDEPRLNGYEVELELPIFNWGGTSIRRAEAQYMASVNRTAAIAQRAQSQVREAYSAYRTTYDVARHYQTEIVPLRKKISEELLLRYNGMLVSVFELLADARAQVNSVNGAINAQRDYWIAENALQMAINGTGGEAPSVMSAGGGAGGDGGAQH